MPAEHRVRHAGPHGELEVERELVRRAVPHVVVRARLACAQPHILVAQSISRSIGRMERVLQKLKLAASRMQATREVCVEWVEW